MSKIDPVELEHRIDRRLTREGTNLEGNMVLTDKTPDDVTLTTEEAELCKLTRKGITHLLKNNPLVAPEDVVRTLFGIVESYARSLPSSNEAKRIIEEDATLLFELADRLRY